MAVSQSSSNSSPPDHAHHGDYRQPPNTQRNTATQTTLALRNALRNNEVSARELTETALSQVAHHHHLGAFISQQADTALRAADHADTQLRAAKTTRQRHDLAPLLGIPTAHKDLIDVAGVPTTHGSRATPHTIAAADDPVVAAVRLTGAISIGKTQVPEFGIAAYSENLIAPPARNPHDPSRTPGGSSGGTAASIAAGVLSGAIASDGGGSIRIPAAACGLIGLKPGRGRIPADVARSQPNPWGAPPLVVSGPLAHTASDAALWFDALRGDTKESSLAAIRSAADLQGLRIGVSTASPFADWVDISYAAATLEALQHAATLLTANRHSVAEATFRYHPSYPDAFQRVWSQQLGSFADDPARFAQLGTLAQWFAHNASQRSSESCFEAARTLNACAAQARQQWDAYDVILTPTIAFAPPKIATFTSLDAAADYRLQCQWAPITSLVNVTGLPAVSIPVARTSNGLPVSVQLIGKAGSEAQLLQLAEQLSAPTNLCILAGAYE